MRILLADGTPKVREALRLVVEQHANHQVAGEARDAINLMAQVTQCCPDVVLVDAELPGLQPARRVGASNLAELVSTLRRLCPTLRVIALSSQPTAEQHCLQAGADAFICKSDPPDHLLALLEQYGCAGERLAS